MTESTKAREPSWIPTLLLAEDNPADVWLLNDVLQRHEVKLHLVIANDGHEALLLLEKIESGLLSCPDLFVLDINLPKRSGFEVLERIRSSSACQETPVVILTSSDSAQDRKQAARFGVASYLKKASELTEMAKIGSRLKELLGERNLE